MKLLPGTKLFGFPFFLIWLVFWLFLVFFIGPPFLSYDSYHYLSLGIHPIANDAHSMGFGWILLLLAKISNLFSQSLFVYLYLGLNGFFFITCAAQTLTWFQNHQSKLKFWQIFILGVLFFYVFLGNLFLINALWTEIVSLFTVFIFVQLAKKLGEGWSPKKAALMLLLITYAYHIRYQLILLPVLLIILPAISLLRGSRSSIQAKTAALGVLGLISIKLSTSILSATLPNSQATKGLTHSLIEGSILCTLRCDANIYTVNCSNEQQKQLIESLRCVELITGQKNLGQSLANPAGSVIEIFKQIGITRTLRWIALAPISYLHDLHSTELDHFQFGAREEPLKDYPQVYPYFHQYFENHYQGNPSKLYLTISKIASVSFSNHVFHVITVIIILGCLAALLFSNRKEIQLLALYSLGTYLMFSYFNPHVPFRFLMQIISPGFAAIVLFFGSMNSYKALNSTEVRF
jgi:hypothetical protein